jgi:hypothetical protein
MEKVGKSHFQEMVISHKNKHGISVEVWEGLHAILGGFLKSVGVEPCAEWKVFCDVYNQHAKAVAKRGYAP